MAKPLRSSDEMTAKRINRLGRAQPVQTRGTHGKTKLSLMKCNVCGGQGAEVITAFDHQAQPDGSYVECKHCNALLDGERHDVTSIRQGYEA